MIRHTVALKVPPSCSRKYMSSPLFSLPEASGMEVGSMLKIQPSFGGPSEYRSYLRGAGCMIWFTHWSVVNNVFLSRHIPGAYDLRIACRSRYRVRAS